MLLLQLINTIVKLKMSYVVFCVIKWLHGYISIGLKTVQRTEQSTQGTDLHVSVDLVSVSAKSCDCKINVSLLNTFSMELNV